MNGKHPLPQHKSAELWEQIGLNPLERFLIENDFPDTDQLRLELYKLHQRQRLTVDQIADRYGVSAADVRRAFRLLGLPFYKPRPFRYVPD